MPKLSSNDQPKSLRAAVLCLWLSVGIVALITLATWANVLGLISTPSLTVNNLLTLALLVLIAFNIGAGRGWARWLFAVVYVLGALMTLYLVLFVPQSFRSMPTLLQVTGLLQLVLQTAAMVLVFVPASTQWFTAKRSQAA
jgi:glucan phosphoethanolaminetransferase (alkaline phosphatase superfamily)